MPGQRDVGIRRDHRYAVDGGADPGPIRPGVRWYWIGAAIGVLGLISAFNFPAAVWAWGTTVALVCGNAGIAGFTTNTWSLTDEEWERFIVDVRETFNARGTLSSQGSLKQWSNGNLQVLLEPTAAGHRVRFRTVKGSAPGQLGGGLAMGAVAMLGEITAVLTGAGGDLGLLASFGVLGLFGLGMAATTAFKLPEWAVTRKSQMEDLGARVSAMALEPPPEPE